MGFSPGPGFSTWAQEGDQSYGAQSQWQPSNEQYVTPEAVPDGEQVASRAMAPVAASEQRPRTEVRRAHYSGPRSPIVRPGAQALGVMEKSIQKRAERPGKGHYRSMSAQFLGPHLW